MSQQLIILVNELRQAHGKPTFIVHHLKTIHSANADDWLFKAKLLCLIII